eukprot:TRINITY_DN37638_c0_g1_i1.p1 TRINITY_DN37638_c0_g1~~TRINITY_DN37638_c0_g1_i1.p1  ORF type:complete len:138 (+),score=2.61 TRINITY_DN37638_c0_g1_i1:168-581(+)
MCILLVTEIMVDVTSLCLYMTDLPPFLSPRTQSAVVLLVTWLVLFLFVYPLFPLPPLSYCRYFVFFFFFLSHACIAKFVYSKLPQEGVFVPFLFFFSPCVFLELLQKEFSIKRKKEKKSEGKEKEAPSPPFFFDQIS